MCLVLGDDTPVVETTLLHGGVGGAAAVNPGMLVYGGRCNVPVWGNGVELVFLNPPGRSSIEFGLRMHSNLVFTQPLNAHKIKQGA